MTRRPKWSVQEKPRDVSTAFYQEFKTLWAQSAASRYAIANAEGSLDNRIRLLIEDIQVALSSAERLIADANEYIDKRMSTRVTKDSDLDVLMMVTHDLAVPVSRGKALCALLIEEKERDEQQPESRAVLTSYLKQITQIVEAFDTH